MKKIFYIIATVLLLVSCCVGETSKVQKSETKRDFIHILYNGNMGLAMHAFRFDYDGHKYILFRGGETCNGIVHDPDCPCNTVEAASKTETSDYLSW